MHYLTQELWFPDANEAFEDGLLDMGGDLSTERLLLAYRKGVFPWFENDTPILWWSPDPRFVLFPENLKVSKSMAQVLRNKRFKVTINQDFGAIIEQCASMKRTGQEGTWITQKMISAYTKLYELGYAKANPPIERSGKTVAVVGSGPAGLAAAAQLNKVGHLVTVFERADRIGGLLRYGIPDFKLEKWTIDRKIALMEEEGIVFKTNANIGVNMPVTDLTDNFDAVVLCGGSTVPRDLPIKGRHFKGVHFAMNFLTQSNKRVAGDEIAKEAEIMATDKNVLVIGGGDTGSDCVGTSNRHKAKSVTQIELLVKPPNERAESTPWPLWPMELRTSSSHEEGCDRKWAILTKEFIGDKKGNLKAVKLVDIEWKVGENGRSTFVEVEGTEREIPCELALLAIGFVHPLHDGMLQQLKVELDNRGNVQADDYQTSVEKIFTAGDMRRGQSLVVWAIAEGREAARKVDEFLMGESLLEARDESKLSLSAVPHI